MNFKEWYNEATQQIKVIQDCIEELREDKGWYSWEWIDGREQKIFAPPDELVYELSDLETEICYYENLTLCLQKTRDQLDTIVKTLNKKQITSQHTEYLTKASDNIQIWLENEGADI